MQNNNTKLMIRIFKCNRCRLKCTTLIQNLEVANPFMCCGYYTQDLTKWNEIKDEAQQHELLLDFLSWVENVDKETITENFNNNTKTK